jgi:hypothetical protein
MDLLPARPPSLLDPQLLWATFALIATLLLGALIFAWLDRWRKRTTEGTLSPGEQLAAFRSSYDRGEMSQEEYERVRAKLAPQVRREHDLPPVQSQDPAGRGRQRPEGGSPPPPVAERPASGYPAGPPEADRPDGAPGA